MRARVARVVLKHDSPADRLAQPRRNLPTPVILFLRLALAQSGRVVILVGIGVVSLALLGLVRRKKVVPEKVTVSQSVHDSRKDVVAKIHFLKKGTMLFVLTQSRIHSDRMLLIGARQHFASLRSSGNLQDSHVLLG